MVWRGVAWYGDLSDEAMPPKAQCRKVKVRVGGRVIVSQGTERYGIRKHKNFTIEITTRLPNPSKRRRALKSARV